MSLAMLAKDASYEFRWRRWALLRDAVVAHLENGQSGSRFPNFAAIATAFGAPSTRLPAAALAQEIAVIRSELATRTVDDLVVGPPTASVLYPTTRPDATRPLTRAELNQIAPVGDAIALDQYFSSMLDSMLHVCAHAHADGMIELFDG